MTYRQSLEIVYDRYLFGAQAYNLARVPGETRSAKEIFSYLCFRQAMLELAR